MSETRLQTLSAVFAERADQEQLLRWKHPGFDVIYNWVIVLTVLALFWGFFWWGIQIRTDRKAEEMTAQARAAWEADQAVLAKAEAEEQEAVRQAQEFVINQEADAVAQLLFGIRNFQTKYGYSEKDLETYVRSAFNRAAARNQDLAAVIFEENQYIAASSHNDITPEYRELARRLVEEWHEEDYSPCDTAFQYAELTPYGIYLRRGYGEDRWHA